MKEEEEKIKLQDCILPIKKRLKISTFRIAERYRRQRIGEGAIGLLLWKWQQTIAEEVYVMVFDKHDTFILQFERFEFQKKGIHLNGENVLIKSRRQIDFSDSYMSFPFIKDGFDYAGYIIIDD